MVLGIDYSRRSYSNIEYATYRKSELERSLIKIMKENDFVRVQEITNFSFFFHFTSAGNLMVNLTHTHKDNSIVGLQAFAV